MKFLIIESVVAGLVFLLFKGIIVLLCKISRIIFDDKGNEQKFDFGVSVAMQILFLGIWATSIGVIMNLYPMDNFVCYTSLLMMGVVSIIWCYFSWDAEHIFVKPRKANNKEKRLKKIVVYGLILLFVLVLGYHQTLHAVGIEEKIDTLMSVTNYSIVVGTIAFDRLMNQIVQ